MDQRTPAPDRRDDPAGASAGPPPLPVDQQPLQPGPPPLPHAAADVRQPTTGSTSVCSTCGSQMRYAPGTRVRRCVSCGSEQTISDSDSDAIDTTIDEHSFEEWIGEHQHLRVASLAGTVVSCQGCGAQLDTVDLAVACQFCGGHLMILDQPAGVISPEAVVPFGVDGPAAGTAFRAWVSSRWFAPSALKKVGSTESLQGTYVPHWTFDAATRTRYTGRRGEHYYVTRTRSVSDGKGGTRTESYQERRTRWYPASGRVARSFDDVVVPASRRIAPERLASMGPWQLEDAAAFRPEYLSGYSALRYDVDPQDGSTQARREMEEVIDGDIRRDIGGDEQQVTSTHVTYSAAMFKLVLMPLWIATYLYGGKTWQVMVNANTAEVVGDRPWSKVKIVAVALLVAVLVAVAAFLIRAHQTGSSADVDESPSSAPFSTVTGHRASTDHSSA